MSFDIMGINPTYPNKHSEGFSKLAERKLDKIVENSKEVKLSEKDRVAYCELLDEKERNDPGREFRCNNWTWRPLHGLLSMVITKHNLLLRYWMWGDNSGYGIKNIKEKREILLDLENNEDVTIKEREEILKNLETSEDFVEDPDTTCRQLGLLLEEEIKDLVDTIYLNTGVWVNKEGKFARDEDLVRFADAIRRGKSKLLLPGPILPTIAGDIAIEDDMLYPAHSCKIETVQKFCRFLKYCGGFRIY